MPTLSKPPTNTDPDPVYLSNRRALKKFKKERKKLSLSYYGLGLGALAAGWFNFLWLVMGVSTLAFHLRRLQKVSQIYLNMGRLLNAFEDRGIEIIPEIAVPELGNLDLLVKFPDRLPCLAIALRSQGSSLVFYNEEKESLFFRRINKKGEVKGWYRWEPDHIQRLSDQEYWLRKNQRFLFGKSSKEKRRPVVKLLVLTGDTRLGANREHLYCIMGKQKALLINRRTSLYVVEEKKLINFIEGWLAQSHPNSHEEG